MNIDIGKKIDIVVVQRSGGDERRFDVKGYSLSIVGWEKFSFGVHKALKASGWIATELTTGLLAASGETRKEAVADLAHTLEKHGQAKMQAIIDKGHGAEPEVKEETKTTESNGSAATWTLDFGAPTAKQKDYPVLCNFHVVCHVRGYLVAEFSWMQVMKISEAQKNSEAWLKEHLVHHGHYIRTHTNIMLHRDLQGMIIDAAVKLQSNGGFPATYKERLKDTDVQPK